MGNPEFDSKDAGAIHPKKCQRFSRKALQQEQFLLHLAKMCKCKAAFHHVEML